TPLRGHGRAHRGDVGQDPHPARHGRGPTGPRPRLGVRGRWTGRRHDPGGCMSDRYASLISTAPGRALAKRLGLPQPVTLRRHEPGEPLLPGPVLVLDGAEPGTDGEGPDTDALAATLLGWGL